MINKEVLGLQILDCSIEEVILAIKDDRNSLPESKIVVTPNVDHFSRLNLESGDDFSSAYASASMIICDSRIIKMVSGVLGHKLNNVVPGSDLTKKLLTQKWLVSSKLCVIGGLEGEIASVSARYGLARLSHYNPPMGFIKNPLEIDKCVNFVCQSDAEYVFLAVGSPRQEVLAKIIQDRLALLGKETRFIFCIGASFDFLSGKISRAPRWVQVLCLEWLHRALSEPRRMIPRYYKNFVWLTKIMIKHIILKMGK